jgi:hypothetical protein
MPCVCQIPLSSASYDVLQDGAQQNGANGADGSTEVVAQDGEIGKRKGADSENENPPMTGSMLVPASLMMQSRPVMPSAPATCSLEHAEGLKRDGAEGSVSLTRLGEQQGPVPPLSLYGDLAVYMFEGPTSPMTTSAETANSVLQPLVPLIVEPPIMTHDATRSEDTQSTAGPHPVDSPGMLNSGYSAEVVSDVARGMLSDVPADVPPADVRSEPMDCGPVPRTNWLRVMGPLQHVAHEAALTAITGAVQPQEIASDIEVAHSLPATAPAPQDLAAPPKPEAIEPIADSVDSAMSAGPGSISTPPSSQASLPEPTHAFDRTADGRDGSVAIKSTSTGAEPADAVVPGGKEMNASAASTASAPPQPSTATVAGGGLLHPFHIMLFGFLAAAFSIACIAILNYTTEMGWMWSSMRVLSRVSKGLAFRQCIALLSAMAFVRYGLEPFVKAVRTFFMPGDWERSSEFFVLQQVRCLAGKGLAIALLLCIMFTAVNCIAP